MPENYPNKVLQNFNSIIYNIDRKWWTPVDKYGDPDGYDQVEIDVYFNLNSKELYGYDFSLPENFWLRIREPEFNTPYTYPVSSKDQPIDIYTLLRKIESYLEELYNEQSEDAFDVKLKFKGLKRIPGEYHGRIVYETMFEKLS